MRPRLASIAGASAAFACFGAHASCGGAPRPSVETPRAAWVASVTTPSAATIRDLAVTRGGVLASVGHRGSAALSRATLAPPAGGADVDARDVASVAMIGEGGRAAWAITVAALPGPVAVSATGDLSFAAFGSSEELRVGTAAIPVRGEPGATVLALASADGAVRWSCAVGSTEWVLVADLAALPDGDLAVVGQFAGTLRIGDQVVTSAGNADGFVVRLGRDGRARWLVRIGGDQADGVSGVTAVADRLAIAGTFSGIADLRGTALTPVDERAPGPDGFVATLDGNGAPRWAYAFGSRGADAVAGVAVTASGAIAVAATVRDAAWVSDGDGAVVAGGISDFSTRGSADGLVAVWDRDGRLRGSSLVGGSDYDGLRAIAPRGDHVLVGGWFTGTIEVGAASWTAAGDDGLVAIVDDRAQVSAGLHANGAGREDIAALAGSAASTGWAAAVTHTTAARVTTSDASLGALAAPADPLGGAAIVFGVR